MRVLLFALIALLAPARADAEAVRVTVRPEQVHIERASSGQLLNFDFLLENLTADKLRIIAIRVHVFDRTGRLILKRVLDEHGLSPGIETIPRTEPAYFRNFRRLLGSRIVRVKVGPTEAGAVIERE